MPATHQQLLTVWWVPQQLLQKAVFDTFSFEGGVGGGGGGTKNPFLGRTPIFYQLWVACVMVEGVVLPCAFLFLPSKE